jgi:uncharacterized membrane-anchored protein YitT (DUF2179 family)
MDMLLLCLIEVSFGSKYCLNFVPLKEARRTYYLLWKGISICLHHYLQANIKHIWLSFGLHNHLFYLITWSKFCKILRSCLTGLASIMKTKWNILLVAPKGYVWNIMKRKILRWCLTGLASIMKTKCYILFVAPKGYVWNIMRREHKQ